MCFFGHAGDPRWGESEVTSLQLGLKSGAGASVRGIQRELNEHLKDTSFGTDGTCWDRWDGRLLSASDPGSRAWRGLIQNSEGGQESPIFAFLRFALRLASRSQV